MRSVKARDGGLDTREGEGVVLALQGQPGALPAFLTVNAGAIFNGPDLSVNRRRGRRVMCILHIQSPGYSEILLFPLVSDVNFSYGPSFTQSGFA